MRLEKGFTLIELISVMVVLGIIATLTSQFIVSAVDSYGETQARQRLLAKGRTSVEQMARYLRASVPNSVRVSSSGQCVELLPTVGGAFYEERVAEESSCTVLSSALTTSPFNPGLGTAEHIVIGGLDSTEIYNTTVPSARVEISSTNGPPVTALTFTPHCFNRNSINNRVYIADNPVRFCLSSGNLVLIENYPLVTSFVDGSPGAPAETIQMADGVAADGTAFVLSNGTEDRSASLDVNLVFSQESISVGFNQTVLIRNVP